MNKNGEINNLIENNNVVQKIYDATYNLKFVRTNVLFSKSLVVKQQ